MPGWEVRRALHIFQMMRKIPRFRIWEYSCLEHYTHRDIAYFVICLIIAVLCANKFKLHYCKYFQDPVKISQKISSKMWASQFVYQLWKPKASTQPPPLLPHKSTAKNLLTSASAVLYFLKANKNIVKQRLANGFIETQPHVRSKFFVKK